MGELEQKAEAFLEATQMHVADAEASGLPAIAIARLLFGFSLMHLERTDGQVRAAEFLRHQLQRLENSSTL
jgi:hypothetical protein